MPEVWQTIEQAAVTLGLSVRTVNRHITGGKLQSRLFEGRREVLVSLPEPVKTREPIPRPQPTSTSSAADASSANPSAAPAGGSAEPAVNFTMGQTPSAAASVAADIGTPHSQQYDSVRRAMAADYAAEKPLDMQTMLTLADSVDDKASLAVAAYQTLAHSAEVQVQSLRRVALGAWASVGLLAAGAIVAVGWGTYRLTWAEGTVATLRTQVDEQKEHIQSLVAEEKIRQKDLQQAQLEAARLEMLLRDQPTAQTVAELANYALNTIQRDARATSPATQPTSDKPSAPTTAPTTAPATGASTQPTTVPPAGSGTGTSGVVFKPPNRAPATHPASLPAMTGQRPTYITNSREPFDPR